MGQDRGLCVVATNCQRANERTALQASDRRIALGRVYCSLVADGIRVEAGASSQLSYLFKTSSMSSSTACIDGALAFTAGGCAGVDAPLVPIA